MKARPGFSIWWRALSTLEEIATTAGYPSKLRLARKDTSFCIFNLLCVWRIANSGETSNSPHTGVEFGVADLDGEYRRLSGLGVKFTLKPEQQSWGGYMSMFADPEGNVIYLDELISSPPSGRKAG
jgi:hypothetical protein